MTSHRAQVRLRLASNLRGRAGHLFLSACVLLAATGVRAQGTATPAMPATPPSAAKQAAIQSVERHRPELIELSDRIWAYAEIALEEHRSSKALADYAEQQGFRVERGIAGMPTAFLASFGSGRPVIGIMGEYDALPGLSQKAQPSKLPLVEGAAGHGCGHNMFGAASLGAAIAIKEQIQAGKLDGTIRFYGTPAEEDIGGKTYMARDGVFDDVDVMLAWHPGDETKADMDSSQAMVDLAIEFRGRAAHAANDPWNGRSALDALELFTHGVNLMREHIKPSSRLHYTIVDGGDVPNVIPEYAKVSLWARDWQRAEVESLLARRAPARRRRRHDDGDDLDRDGEGGQLGSPAEPRRRASAACKPRAARRRRLHRRRAGLRARNPARDRRGGSGYGHAHPATRGPGG